MMSCSTFFSSAFQSFNILCLILCLHYGQAKFHIIQELLGKLHSTLGTSQRNAKFKSLMEELNEERQKACSMMKRMFNRSFGATFLTDTGQESAFAYHIHQYADVYTSKPENFLFYPPEAWLHVPFDIKIMPHHVKVCLDIYLHKLYFNHYKTEVHYVFMFYASCCWLPLVRMSRSGSYQQPL